MRLLAAFRTKAAAGQPYGRAARRVRIGTVAAAALVVVLSGLVALTLHRREIGDTFRRISLLSTVLSEETSRTFKAIDLVLESLVDEVDRDAIPTPEAFAAARSGLSTHELLAAKRLGLPQVDTLSFVDASGRLLATSGSPPPHATDLSSADYVRALSGGPSTASFLGRPALGPDGQWTMSVARRIQAPDGTFLGIVVCGVNLGGYRQLYASLGIERGVAIGLWRRDGTNLVRYPDASDGRRPGWLDEMGAGRSAVYEADDGPGGAAQVVAARATADMSLVVSVSARRRQALSDWRLFTAFLGIVSGGAIVALVLAGEALRARYLALAERDAALADRERVFEQRERTEAQLRQSQKMDTVGQLAGGIAHDFNNMLAVVVGSLAVLRRRLERGDADVGRFVEAAVEGADRAAGLTRRLLAFARLQDIEPEVLETDAFLAQSAEIAMRTVGRALRFDLALDAREARILVDPSQLENAILNLAINARDAMPAGGTIRLTSAILPSPRGDGPGLVEIAIHDTGTGMPEDVLAQARSPFFTTKAEGEGTGLGLSQVAGFCERSGGRMEIDSRLGHGTVVRLLLPTTEARAGSRLGSDEVPSSPVPALSVLVVDDEESVRATTVAMLRDLGYRVVGAEDPREAMNLVATMPDLALVVSDIVMPGGDGTSLVRDATRLVPGLRGLLVTGLDAPARDDGIPTLSKPYDLGQLARAVRDAITPAEPSAPTRGLGLAA